MERKIRKKLLLARLAVGLAVTAPAHAADLTITIASIPAAEGHLMLQVQANEAQFKGEAEAARGLMVAAEDGSVTVTVADLEPGSYAVRVMHDVNDNGKLDSNLIGMPVEPWGFSNNAMGSFGPPGWKDASFTLDDDLSISIDLNH